MQGRIAKLESDVAHIQCDIGEIKTGIKEMRSDARTDFRLTFGVLMATALGLAGIMARGFGWIG